MKKLLLVPLLTISMLTGCNEKEKVLPIVTLNEWLSDLQFAEGHFFNHDIVMKDYGIMPDYNFVVGDFIKENTKDIEGKKIKECSPAALLTYHVTHEHYPFDFCSIYIHENRIETSAITPYTYDKNKVYQQFYSYPITSTTAAMIIGKAYQRIDEIDDINIDEREKAREIMSPANYFKYIEDSENGAKLTVYGKNDEKDIIVQDTNKALLADFKAMEYTATTEYGNTRLLAYVYDENYYMILSSYDYDQCIANFEIKFDSVLGYSKTLSFRYLVSKNKVNALLEKVDVRK